MPLIKVTRNRGCLSIRRDVISMINIFFSDVFFIKINSLSKTVLKKPAVDTCSIFRDLSMFVMFDFLQNSNLTFWVIYESHECDVCSKKGVFRNIESITKDIINPIISILLLTDILFNAFKFSSH